MSRFGIDPPDDDAYEMRPNAECADCGIPYSKSDLDRTPWCDACSDRRDRWITAQEMKRMAKAVLAVDLMTVKDVA